MDQMKTMKGARKFEYAQLMVDFGKALAHVKDGGKATRNVWVPERKWIRLVELEGTSSFDYGMENKPYLEAKTSDNKLIPWVATQDDLLAEDWMLLGLLCEQQCEQQFLTDEEIDKLTFSDIEAEDTDK